LFFRRVPKDHTHEYEILGDGEKKEESIEGEKKTTPKKKD